MPDPRNRLQWNATCKVYPAIADLQAIESFARAAPYETNVGADYTLPIYEVPAGKILQMYFLMAWCNEADPTHVAFRMLKNATEYTFYYEPYGLAGTYNTWSGNSWFDEGEEIVARWYGTTATSGVGARMLGFLVDKY